MKTAGRTRILLRMLAPTLIGAVLLSGASAKSPERPAPRTIRILASDPGAAEHALAALYSRHLKLAPVRVRTVPTSHARLVALNAGEGELAIVAGHVLAAAHAGKAEFSFTAKLSKLRTIAALHDELLYVVAAKDAGIAKLADLRGKRVSVGPPRSDSELAARAILAAVGVRPEDFRTAEYLPFADAAELLKKKELDAFFYLGPPADPELRALAGDIVLVEIPPALVAKLGAPFRTTAIPVNANPGQTKTATALVPYWLVTRDDLSAAMVHDLTKTLFNHAKELAAGGTIHSAPPHAPAPLHPSAGKYYREKGH